MKVALDVCQTGIIQAGCAWHAHSLAHAFRALLPPEDLILYHGMGKWVHDVTEHGIRIPDTLSPFQGLPKQQAAAIWQSVAEGKQEAPGRPDIVHSCSFMAPKVGSAKLVYTIHDLCFWTHPDYSTFANAQICQEQLLEAMDHAAAFHFVSQSTLDVFEDLFPGWLTNSRKPSLVVRSGNRLAPQESIDPQSRFQNPHAPWLHVGTIEPRKNVDALLDAYERYYQLSEIKRPLVLAGNQGWQSESTIARIEELKKQLPVQMLGYVSEDQLSQLYQEAFALVYPSHFEGFGLPLSESLAFHLPAIVNPSPAAREFEHTAWRFIYFSDPQKVAENMIDLESQDPERYISDSHKNAAASQHISWEKTARSLLEFYEYVLSGETAQLEPAAPAKR